VTERGAAATVSGAVDWLDTAVFEVFNVLVTESVALGADRSLARRLFTDSVESMAYRSVGAVTLGVGIGVAATGAYRSAAAAGEVSMELLVDADGVGSYGVYGAAETLA
jgi:hypothetical protein